MNEAVSTTEVAAPSPQKLMVALLWVGVLLLAVLTAVQVFGSDSPVRFVLPGLIGLAGVAAFVAKRPALSIAWIPVLMVPPEFLKVFAYEVVTFLLFGMLLLVGIFRRRSWVWRLDPIELTVIGFLAYGAFTYFWVVNSWWWLFMIRKLCMGIIALWTARQLGRWIPRQTLFSGIAAGACAVAAFAVYVSFTVGASSDLGVARTEATNVGWATSNSLAALLVLMVPTVTLIALRSGNRVHHVQAELEGR